MASQQDDCYFYYYSSCNKGDACNFRHCEAALGNETVCTLWQEGRCFRDVCKFRHMHIKKDRSSIPCYWESQPSGCSKPHCPFLHSKDRQVLATDSKSHLPEGNASPALVSRQVVQQGSPQVEALTPGSSTDNESVKGPKVEQVVINPFDEESDQESTAGTSPLKVSRSECILGAISRDRTCSQRTFSKVKGQSNLNFGIKTLDDIRQDKLAMAKRLVAEADNLVAIDLPALEQKLLADDEGDVGKRPSSNLASRNVVVAKECRSKPSVHSRLGPRFSRHQAGRLDMTERLSARHAADRQQADRQQADRQQADRQQTSQSEATLVRLAEKPLSGRRLTRVVSGEGDKAGDRGDSSDTSVLHTQKQHESTEPRTDVAKIQQEKPTTKRKANWEVKTFSEIMHEKRLKQQREAEKTSLAEKTTTTQTTTITAPPIKMSHVVPAATAFSKPDRCRTKRCFSPIVFDDAGAVNGKVTKRQPEQNCSMVELKTKQTGGTQVESLSDKSTGAVTPAVHSSVSMRQTSRLDTPPVTAASMQTDVTAVQSLEGGDTVHAEARTSRADSTSDRKSVDSPDELKMSIAKTDLIDSGCVKPITPANRSARRLQTSSTDIDDSLLDDDILGDYQVALADSTAQPTASQSDDEDILLQINELLE